jgi:hypothetical protein
MVSAHGFCRYARAEVAQCIFVNDPKSFSQRRYDSAPTKQIGWLRLIERMLAHTPTTALTQVSHREQGPRLGERGPDHWPFQTLPASPRQVVHATRIVHFSAPLTLRNLFAQVWQRNFSACEQTHSALPGPAVKLGVFGATGYGW